MSTDTLRPMTKRDITATWELTFYRAGWWGDFYMFLREPNPYPDKLKNWTTDDGPSDKSKRHVVRTFMKPWRAGECTPVTLGHVMMHKPYSRARAEAFPVLRARAGDGQLLRGLPDRLNGTKTWAAVDPRKSLYIEKRLGEGTWHLTPDRKAFLYAHEGKLLAAVMAVWGVREASTPQKEVR